MTHALLKAGLLAGLPLLLAACEVGPKKIEQQGHRGTGMVQINAKSGLPGPYTIPDEAYRDWEPDRSPDAERAGDFYQNIQVLNDLTTDEFNRLMVAITEWVSPEGSDPNGGCNYCHNPENLASDEVYTKVVTRKMLQMTRAINVNWANHVQPTGVTCYTCHRGKPVPDYYWTIDPESQAQMGMQVIRGNRFGQNNPDQPGSVYSSLPHDPFTAYIKQADPTERAIRVVGNSAYPSRDGSGATLQNTEMTYGFMMHFSDSLGVNCTFCHNTNNFGSWTNSQATRVGSWAGIRMVRDANENYITPLTSVFPANRLGPQGDPFKVNCATCHQGANKPLGGINMADAFPELKVLGGPTVVAATPSPDSTAAVAASPEG
ncbi:MAG: photosynthetic reaction center cytochrome PufC [Sphingomonadaceae bacterium]